MSITNKEQEQQRLWVLGEALTEEVRGSSGKALRGADLGQRVRVHDSSILAETGMKLVELLDRYAPDLAVVGRSGNDLIWGIELSGEAPSPNTDGAIGVPVPDGGGAQGVQWESVRFNNYRSIKSAVLELDKLTVLVGRNGVGKSNILDGIFRISRLTERKPSFVFSGRHSIDRVAGRWAPEHGFELEAIATQGWRFVYTSGNPYEPPSEKPQFQVFKGKKQPENRWSLGFTPLGKVFGGAVYLHLDAFQLARQTYSLDEVPFLRHDGVGLGPVLATIAQSDRGRLERLIKEVQAIVPRVQDIRTDRQVVETRNDGTQVVNGVEVKMAGVGWVAADQLSEGTLLVIGLHTVLSGPQPPRVILLDDIDRGLHPAAQRALIQQLMGIASSECRIVCTSHSPYVLDPLAVDAVRVVTSDVDGATQIYRITEHPEWSSWGESMTPAEFWQYAGDEVWPHGNAK